MEKGLLHKQIMDFFVRNFDVRQEKEDELETIESIKKGIEFKGDELMGTYFRYVCRFSWVKYQLYGRDYWRDVDLAADGTDHGIRLGIGYLRFRLDQAIVP